MSIVQSKNQKEPFFASFDTIIGCFSTIFLIANLADMVIIVWYITIYFILM